MMGPSLTLDAKAGVLPADGIEARSVGLRSLEVEIAGMQQFAVALAGDLGAAFDAAVQCVLDIKGRLVVSGIGKSGHIGRKIAATFASTGTPSFFVHPAEASHGDLGMVTTDDAILALSWSGETTELGDMISYSRRFQVPLIAVTGNPGSTLALAADIVLGLPKARESCPHDLAPTTSTVLQLAMGDALAIALLEKRGFTALGFKTFHPGGKLAARLKTVGQLMHADDEMPLVKSGTVMSEVLIAIAGRRYGCVGVLDAKGALIGIVTDGDLRRHMGPSILSTPVDAVMTPDPMMAAPALLASAALQLMNARRITALFIVEEGRPLGILHIHDLLRAGVV